MLAAISLATRVKEYFRIQEIEPKVDSVLLAAILNGETAANVSHLVSERASLLEERTNAGEGPLTVAMLNRRADLMHVFLAYSTCISELEDANRFPVDIAVAYGDLQAVRTLAERTTLDPFHLPFRTCGLLATAAHFGHLKIVKYLIAMSEGLTLGETDDFDDAVLAGGPRDTVCDPGYESVNSGVKDAIPQSIFNPSNRDKHINPDWTLSWVRSAIQSDQLEVFQWALSSYYCDGLIRHSDMLDKSASEAISYASLGILDWMTEDASEIGDVVNIRKIVQRSPEVLSIWGNLGRRRSHESFCRWTIEKMGLDVLQPIDKSSCVLERVCQSGDAESLQMLIEEYGVRVNCIVLSTSTNDTPLTVALRAWMEQLESNPESSPAAVRLLAKHGCSINVRYQDGYLTPVIEAARDGHLVAVRFLVEELGADLTICRARASALDHACSRSHKNVAMWIYNYMERNGTLYKVLNSSTVNYCLARDLIDMAKSILKKYPRLADRDDIDSSTRGTTVLDSALRLNHVSFAKWLLNEPGLNISLETHYTNGTLARCVRHWKSEAVAFIVAQFGRNHTVLDETIAITDASDMGLVSYAAGMGAIDIVVVLIEVGGVNVPNSISNEAPGFMALINGKCAILRYFVENCGLELTSHPSSVDLLYLAAAGENLDPVETRALFRFLLDDILPKDALDFTNRSGRTALIHAAEHGRDLVVRILLESGAHWNWQDGDGLDAPAHAIMNDHLKTVKVFYEFGGANVFSPRHLHLAVASGAQECFDYLIDIVFQRIFRRPSAVDAQLQIELNTDTEESYNPNSPFDVERMSRIKDLFVTASVANQYEMIVHFICNRRFNRPGLHWPISLNLDFRRGWQGTKEMWKKLFTLGFVGQLLNAPTWKLVEAKRNSDLLDTKIPFTTTHLHSVIEACSTGNLPWLKALVESGADLHISTPHGLTPLLAACSAGSIPIVKWLMNKGCSIFQETPLGTPLFVSRGLVRNFLLRQHNVV